MERQKSLGLYCTGFSLDLFIGLCQFLSVTSDLSPPLGIIYLSKKKRKKIKRMEGNCGGKLC